MRPRGRVARGRHAECHPTARRMRRRSGFDYTEPYGSVFIPWPGVMQGAAALTVRATFGGGRELPESVKPNLRADRRLPGEIAVMTGDHADHWISSGERMVG